MKHDIEYISSQFNNSELILIAEELGLAPTSRWGNRKLTDICLKCISDKGIPDPPDSEELSKGEELLEDFLYVAEFIDDEGNITEQKEEEERLSLEDFLKVHNLVKPPCFSYADPEDPACKKCPVMVYCSEERLALLPPCFGLLYDPHDEECGVCIEAPFCKINYLKDLKEKKDGKRKTT